MELSECLSVISLIIAETTEQIHCTFCQDDSCIKIVINNFYSKVINANKTHQMLNRLE